MTRRIGALQSAQHGAASAPHVRRGKTVIEPRIQGLARAHVPFLLDLHRAAASVAGSGLARARDEITADYVQGFVDRAVHGGILLGAFIGHDMVGEIHAVRIGPRQFDHVVGDLTVAVHPEAQGMGVGSALFDAFFERTAAAVPAITRIELVARSGNIGALRLYERLGFVQEGRLVDRVRLPDGRMEDDIFMARRS